MCNAFPPPPHKNIEDQGSGGGRIRDLDGYADGGGGQEHPYAALAGVELAGKLPRLVQAVQGEVLVERSCHLLRVQADQLRHVPGRLPGN